jgi:hypothetical protein
MTTVQSPTTILGSALDETSQVFAAATDPSSVGASDLIYAYALLEASEIMLNQPNVNTLLSVVAEYGTTIISADGIAIINRTSGRWRPVIVREIVDEPDVAGVHQVVESLAADGWLEQYRRVDDLDQDGRWGGLPVSSNRRAWRSLLVVPSEPRNDHAPTLMWWSRESSAFIDQSDIAELFARSAGLAIHNVNARDNLAQAVTARHRVCLAQGILMSRLGCSQDQAIAILKDQSQRTNRELRLIAEEVIRIGDLEPASTAREPERIQ